MNDIPSKIKLTNFRNKIKECFEQEVALRVKMKRLYDQFLLDVGDDRLAQRHVRLSYFMIQKERLSKLIQERLEFHPFFTARPAMSEDDELHGEIDDDLV